MCVPPAVYVFNFLSSCGFASVLLLLPPSTLFLFSFEKGPDLPVVKLRSPAELASIFEGIGVPLPLKDGEPALDHAALLKACEATLEYSVNTANPHFNNQLYGTADPYGIAGDWLVAVLNANSHTFEVKKRLTRQQSAQCVCPCLR
jgi:hypothetical protein